MFFMQAPEPAKSFLAYIRTLIHASAPGVQEKMSYGMPFYYLRGRRFCYLWIQKATGWPYIGIVNGSAIDFPGLEAGERSKMKIFPVDPDKDMPDAEIKVLLGLAIVAITG